MIKLARAAVHRPKSVLALWAAVIGVLGFVGLGVEERLHRTALIVDGTPAAAATETVLERFGESVTFAVMLEGPERILDREGPKLADRLDRLPHTAALTPWMEGSGNGLRPSPDRALLILRGDSGFEAVSRDAVPEARAILDQHVPPSLEARMTGTPDIAAGVHGDTVSALHKAELIAAPILLLVLLVVFRSPLAAAVPLLLGIATVAGGNGVISLVNELKPLDAAALNMGSMMGLALGVDYSLLLVSRFREELDHGLDGREAALVAVGTAGRTVIFAGLALAVAMAVAAMVAPGDLLASASIGATTAAVVGIFGGITAVPAALTLLGPRINRWSFGSPSGESRFAGWALRALRRPALAAGAVLAVVLALAIPAAGLETGPPDPRVLAESSPERQDYEAISDALGPGWSAPYEIIVAPESGTVTEPSRLEALASWQQRLSRLDGVAAVYGPGPVAEGAERIDRAAGRLEEAGQELERGREQGRRLTSALDRAGDGVGDLRDGLATATDAASRLESGAATGEEGTAELVAGIGQALDGAAALDAGINTGRAGIERLAGAVERANSGADRLRDGLAEARTKTEAGAARIERLATGLGQGARDLERLREPAQETEAQLRRAQTALDRMLATSKADPQYRVAYEAVGTALAASSGRNPLTGGPVKPGYPGMDESLAEAAGGVRHAEDAVEEIIARSSELSGGLERLKRGSADLAGGMERLDAGAGRLADGIAELGAGGASLTDGLARLEAGSGTLADGVERLRSGVGGLRDGLASGAEKTGRLEAGMDRLEAGAERATARSEKLDGSLGDPGELAEPLGSGYFVLAALDTGKREVRTGSSFTVNVDEGGTAARISVVSEDDPKLTGHPLREVLEDEADRFERETGIPAQVGGGAAILQDFSGAASGRMGLLVLLICAVTGLVLVPVFRSLILPLLAVVLNC